ncbi:MAG: hypothetical protein BJ554DRAFT_7068, partial [Olpidium bornovanus]
RGQRHHQQQQTGPSRNATPPLARSSVGNSAPPPELIRLRPGQAPPPSSSPLPRGERKKAGAHVRNDFLPIRSCDGFLRVRWCRENDRYPFLGEALAEGLQRWRVLSCGVPLFPPTPPLPTPLWRFASAARCLTGKIRLTSRPPRPVCVLKNEFGDAETDSELARESNLDIQEMINGCICWFVRLVLRLGNLIPWQSDGPRIAGSLRLTLGRSQTAASSSVR